MKSSVRWDYLRRSPRIASGILLRGRYKYSFDLMPMCVEGMSLRKRLNLLATGLNLVYRHLGPWARPIRMQIELTNACDLRCPVCPTGRGELQRETCMMDIALVEKLMAELGPYLLDVFWWAWGEPLLHPEFGRAVRIASRYGVQSVISTNGQNLHRRKVREQILQDPPRHLIVALDGMSDETNSVYRAGASVEKTLSGVRQLVDARDARGGRLPFVHMRYIVMEHNRHELPRLETFARASGFDYLALRGLSEVEDALDTHEAMVPKGSDYAPYDYEGEQRVRRRDFVCHSPFIFPTVFADGTVVTCDQDARASRPCGKLDAHTSFREVWRSGPARRVRRQIRADINQVPFCRTCPLKDRRTNTCTVSLVRL